jgi:hypothetical protein
MMRGLRLGSNGHRCYSYAAPLVPAAVLMRGLDPVPAAAAAPAQPTRLVRAFCTDLPGDIFGLEGGEEHRFFAEALCDTKVMSFRRCSLETLAANDADLSRKTVRAMMRSLERAQDHMILLGRKSALEKIATFLLDMAAGARRTTPLTCRCSGATSPTTWAHH